MCEGSMIMVVPSGNSHRWARPLCRHRLLTQKCLEFLLQKINGINSSARATQFLLRAEAYIEKAQPSLALLDLK